MSKIYPLAVGSRFIYYARLRYEEEVHALKQNGRQNYDRVKELSWCNDTEAFSSFWDRTCALLWSPERETRETSFSRKITTLIIPIGRSVFLRPVFKPSSHRSSSRFSESHRRRNCFREGLFPLISISILPHIVSLFFGYSLSFYLMHGGRYSCPDISRVSHFHPRGRGI